MKNALNRLQGRLRARWYQHQARTAIARCNRAVARRLRIGVPLVRRQRAPYFAPGIIDVPERRPRGMRPYVITLVIALASAAFYLVRAGVQS